MRQLFSSLMQFFTAIYKPVFVIYALYVFATVVISLSESIDYDFYWDIASYIPDEVYTFTYQNRYEIVFVFLIFLVIYIVNYVRKLRRKFSQACKSIDDFQRELGDEIAKIMLNYSGSKEIDSHSYNMLSKDLAEFLRKFTNHICKVFSSYTERPCHVVIKTLNEDKVTSWARETSMSDSQRSSIDEALISFPYHDNTAFTHILDKDNASYYLNNCLKIYSNLRKYKNSNPNWGKAYNATLVVPITLNTHPKRIDKGNVWGFVCVDNKGGGFDKISVWILYSFARICFNVFENIPIVDPCKSK